MVFLTRVFAVLALSGGLAGAEDRARSKELYLRGVEHYDLGEVKEALDDFREAYRLYPQPRFFINIGQCYRRLGRSAEARDAFAAFLRRSDGDEKVESDVRAMLADLDAELAARPPPGPAPHAEGPPPAAVPALSQAPRRTRPAYQKWWVWTTVGLAAAAVGVGLGLGLEYGLRSPTPPATDLGTVRF
jgi:tetratricopeptide (TPR) repeat protein